MPPPSADRPRTRARRRAGFSLLELVITVAIIGLVSAIAVPRLTGLAERSGDTAQTANTDRLQRAIEHYLAEHGAFPTNAGIARQLTWYSSIDGAVSQTRDATHVFGPYVDTIPALTAGPNKGNTAIGNKAGTGIGWIYNAGRGQIIPNTTSGGGSADVVAVDDLGGIKGVLNLK